MILLVLLPLDTKLYILVHIDYLHTTMLVLLPPNAKLYTLTGTYSLFTHDIASLLQLSVHSGTNRLNINNVASLLPLSADLYTLVHTDYLHTILSCKPEWVRPLQLILYSSRQYPLMG